MTAPRPHRTNVATSPARSIDVLIVDDSDDDALLLLRDLRQGWPHLGHRRVDCVQDIVAALAQKRWDVVLCDCNLPGLPVTEALSAISEHDRTTPIIMVTGAVGEDQLIDLIRHGAHDIVLKTNLARLRPAIEREMAEAAMRRDKDIAEASFSRAMDSIAQGIALYDHEDRLVQSNRRYAEILGGESVPNGQTYEATLRNWARSGLLDGEAERFVETQMARHKDPVASSTEVRLRGERWITIEENPTLDGRVITVLTDVTERKAIDTMKSEFVSVVSHELRTPLAAVTASLDLVESGTLGRVPEEAASFVSIASSNADRLMHLVEDLLDTQALERGKLKLNREDTEARAIVERVIAEIQPYAASFNVTFDAKLPRAPAKIHGDPRRLMQVVRNLLSNAVKFSPDGGVVTVRVRQSRSTVRVRVSDQGPGVPDSLRDRMFTKFCQADMSSTRGVEGTGLGLAISRALVEAHGGTIGYRNGRAGGATFHVDLPALRRLGAESVSVGDDRKAA